MAGLYIHIPFCKQACYYCDFHFSTNRKFTGELVSAVAEEMKLQRGYLGDAALETIYFGGGTPSVLTGEEFNILFEALERHYRLGNAMEITVEANPDDLTREKLHMLKTAGVNRLSIGIQSFDDAVLVFLNRAHNTKQAVDSMALARKTGFENISIDLIFAIPGQSLDQWRRNIAQAIALSPEHISAYALTIEEQTVFGKWKKSGRFRATDEETAAQEFEVLMDEMDKAGYLQYEISNFCRPGFASRHNSSYWRGAHYLGVGPSAHSFNGTTRQFNISNNHLYLSSIRQGTVPFEREVLTSSNKINEFIFTSLRTAQGCDLAQLKDAFGYDLYQHPIVESILHNQLAVVEGSMLRLTRNGKLLADKIAADLFADH